MQLSTIIVAVLASSANAWSITFHNNPNCEAQTYRIYEGDSSLTRCFNLGESQPGTSCSDYWNHGNNWGPCGGDGLPFRPQSAFVRHGTCRIYNRKNCEEEGRRTTLGDLQCANLVDGNIGVIQSYKCW